jgi:hypothetical protein
MNSDWITCRAAEKAESVNGKFIFLVLSLLPFVVLFLELMIVFSESSFYGTMDFSTLQAGAILVHWISAMVLWGAGIWLLLALSKKCGFYSFDIQDRLALKNGMLAAALFVFTAIVAYIAYAPFL